MSVCKKIEQSTYKIVRIYMSDHPRHTIATGLTLEEAQEHCSNPDTKGNGLNGPWFDAYYEE